MREKEDKQAGSWSEKKAGSTGKATNFHHLKGKKAIAQQAEKKPPHSPGDHPGGEEEFALRKAHPAAGKKPLIRRTLPHD